MKIKTLIFFFVLITLAFAQNQKFPNFDDFENFFKNGKDNNQGQNDNNQDNNNNNNNNNPGTGTKTINGNTDNGNAGDGNNPDNGNGQNETNPTKDPKQINQDPNNTMSNAFTTANPNLATTATIAQTTQAVFTTKQITPTLPAAIPQTPTTNNDKTPLPTVNLDAQTALHPANEGLPWGKIAMFIGIGVAALFVVGIVFNFINKAKSKNDNLDLNYGVDQAQPEMSTSMFPPQSNTYNQTNTGFNNNYQYGQYGADNQYNQPSNSYGQNYGQDVNFAQRTLSLNRNPAANQQNYQMDQNAREVIYNHRPEAGDEIELRRGDQATIYEKYEDGWAWGYNITTGKTGMFPQQCLA